MNNGLIITLINYIFKFIELVIFARIIMSWVQIPKENQIVKIIYDISEPILAPIREMLNRVLKNNTMMFDFSPIIAIFFLNLLHSFINKYI